MYRKNSINFGKCDTSNSGTHLGKHKSLIFNTVPQMAAPRLDSFDLVIFLISLTRTYSHGPTILSFQEVKKILWLNRLLIVLLVFVSLLVYNNIFYNIIFL